jgi:hypothetical protein
MIQVSVVNIKQNQSFTIQNYDEKAFFTNLDESLKLISITKRYYTKTNVSGSPEKLTFLPYHIV